MLKRLILGAVAVATCHFPATAENSVPVGLYEDALKCSSFYILLDARHVELEMPSMAKIYQDKSVIWMVFAADISGKTMDEVIADQDSYFIDAQEKFYNMEDLANESYVSDTLTRCSDLEQQYRKQLNAAIRR